MRADRDKEIALADADLQKQLTGNESAHTTAVNNANSAHSTATANAEAARKSAEQAALTQLNSTLAQATNDKEASIAGAERTYDQAVVALDAQYGSASSNGDTGIEGATRRSAIKTRDAQYYAARDTSWANTLSASTTLGTSPWTVKAITAANAQASYSNSRASAQAAHDAAMLDATEDWQDATSTAFFNSLVSSSNAKRDYTNSLAGHWADWDEATDGKTGEAPEVPTESMVDSIIGILNPFDTESLEKQFIDTDVPRRPDPSEIHVVYSIYGIVSEHTPEEWEVIREHKNRGWTMSRLFVDDEQQRMKDAGFKLSFRHLDEDAPQPKIPTPSVLPSVPPILPTTPAPAEQPSDYTIPIPESEPQSGLGITDTIIGVFGGTRGDYVDQYFNFLYGVGDNMSFGIGWWLRSTFFDDQADYGGSSYYIGSWVGFVADLAIGGVFKSFGKVFGKELLEQGARNGPVNIARGGSGTNRWWFDMPEGVPPNGPSRFGDEYKNIWRNNPDMPAFSPLTGRNAGEIGVRPDMSPPVRQFWHDHESGHAALTQALRFNSLQQVRKEWYNLRGIYTAAEEAIVHGRAVYLNTNSLRLSVSEGFLYPFIAVTGNGQRYITWGGVGIEITIGLGTAGWINFFLGEK